MEVDRVTIDRYADITGMAVVVDVLRAFTTAAFAIAGGAKEILLAATVEEALGLRDRSRARG